MDNTTYHGVSTVRGLDGKRGIYGHASSGCDASGCAGSLMYLGTYDPLHIENDGEEDFVITDQGYTVTVPSC